MSREELLQVLNGLGDEILDPSEGPETFLLFSQNRPPHDLGMVDGSAPEITVTINARDFTIKQSPGLLASNRSKGTTGAAMWKTTQLLASWLDSSSNKLFSSGIMSASSVVLELGAGIAGLLPLILVDKISRYVATDQTYALKLLRENLDSNTMVRPCKGQRLANPARTDVAALDWEVDDIGHFLALNDLRRGLDWIIMSDCIYNYHLIDPLVQVCSELARHGHQERQVICLVAQQLRQDDVFQDWLDAFARHFRVWRLSDDTLPSTLGSDSGFAIHIGVLRNSQH